MHIAPAASATRVRGVPISTSTALVPSEEVSGAALRQWWRSTIGATELGVWAHPPALHFPWRELGVVPTVCSKEASVHTSHCTVHPLAAWALCSTRRTNDVYGVGSAGGRTMSSLALSTSKLEMRDLVKRLARLPSSDESSPHATYACLVL